ncbi:metal ABC transporter solute-binding protein, Zn/Mn family [Virgibacillus sp. W0430]|uniref:metal ABC transporter solute-binding protein, Zn/Mn family n=1 Tax=Virgibacillus sp. W0430 TaxID=3391580 RepID=UPI003F4790A4
MKRFWKSVGVLFIFSTLLVLAACNKSEETSEGSGDDKISIITTISQIGEPLSVIGGDRVEVNSLMGPSVDPHLYNATHGDIEKIDKADIAFYNGLYLEANMVDIFNEMEKSKPVLAIGETIAEEDLLEDEEGAIDPHIWFDIDLWQQALDAAVEELKAYAPSDAAYFEENKQAYFSEMEQLKADAEKLANIPEEQRVLVTAHDAFGYFGRMHDIEVVGLQGLSTEAEIGVSDIQETINIIKEYKVPAVFMESSINEKSINAVLEGAKNEGINLALGGELYSDAMGEAGTAEGTYLGMYRHNVDTIFKALSGSGE